MAEPVQPSESAAKAPPQANVYTVLLIIAILALGATIGLVLHNLLAPVPDGYGLDVGALFEPPQIPAPPKLPP